MAAVDSKVTLHGISDILEKWKGFEDGGEGKSLWKLFENVENNAALIGFIRSKIKSNKFSNKLLYASVCLLSPENKKANEKDQYNQVIDSGWGILAFNNKGEKGRKSWGKIYNNEKEREEHFKTRASLYKICKEYRGNQCGKGLGKRKCCKVVFKCDKYKQCREYFELIKVKITKINGESKISDVFFGSDKATIRLKNHINNDNTKKRHFSEYLKWMYETTGACYYFRKPLVKGVKDFDAGEIYLAIDSAGLNKRNAEKIAIETIRVIRDYIGVPLLVRQMDLEHKTIKQEKEKYEKSERMLKHLTKPLESLTGALVKVQKDSQDLRAILYDPHRSIFAAASRVQEFFIHKKVVSIGDVRWEIEHDADKYETINDLTSTLSGIIMEIFGSEYRPENPSDLFNHAMGLVFRETKPDPYQRLRKTCKDILGFEQNDMAPISNILCKHENGLVDKLQPVQAKIINAVTAFKYILHYPFKPSETARMNYLPLIVILDDIDNVGITYSFAAKTIVLDGKQGRAKRFLGSLKWDFNCFKRDDFPLPCYSMFIDFVSGFLSDLNTKMKSSKQKKASKIKKVTIHEGSFKVQFDDVPGFDKAAENLATAIDKAIKWESRVHGGDSQKPFLDLIYNAKSMYRKEQVEAKVKCAHTDNALTISLGAAEIKYDKSGLAFSF